MRSSCNWRWGGALGLTQGHASCSWTIVLTQTEPLLVLAALRWTDPFVPCPVADTLFIFSRRPLICLHLEVFQVFR